MKSIFNTIPKPFSINSSISLSKYFTSNTFKTTSSSFNFNNTQKKNFTVLPEFKIRNSKIYKEIGILAKEEGRKYKLVKELYDKNRDHKESIYLYNSIQERVAFNKQLQLFYQRDKVNVKKMELIRRVTKVKSSELNKIRFCTIAEYEAFKTEIYKTHPHLIQYDFERNLAKLDDPNERIDYIMDNYSTFLGDEFVNYYEHPIPYVDGTEYVLIRRPADMVKRLQLYLEDHVIHRFAPKNFKKEMILKNIFIPDLNEEMFTGEGLSDETDLNEIIQDENIRHLFYLSELLPRIEPKDICKAFDEAFCHKFVTFAYKDFNPIDTFENFLYKPEEFAIAHVRYDCLDDLRKRFNFDRNEDQPQPYEFNLYREYLNNDRVSYQNTYLTQHREMISGVAKTLDNHRIDVGMIITRPPIFLTINKNEVDYNRYKNEFYRKYEIDLDTYVNDLESFNTADSMLFREYEKLVRNHFDNEPNTRINKNVKREVTNEEEFSNELYKYNPDLAYANSYLVKDNVPDDDYHFYCRNSKHYMRVDPRIKNDRLIQNHPCFDIFLVAKNKYTGKWEFPSFTMDKGTNFRDGLETLATSFSKERFKVFFPGVPPIIQISREFYEHERDDPRNKGLYGVRTYLFPAYHDQGQPEVFESKRHYYCDFALVRKNDLNKYFDEEYYSLTVPYLKN